MRTHTHPHTHKHIYVCVCVCVCIQLQHPPSHQCARTPTHTFARDECLSACSHAECASVCARARGSRASGRAHALFSHALFSNITVGRLTPFPVHVGGRGVQPSPLSLLKHVFRTHASKTQQTHQTPGTLATPRGSISPSCLMWMPRSTPMARAVRIVSLDCAGPTDTATISLTMPFSLRRTASSTAISQKGFMLFAEVPRRHAPHARPESSGSECYAAAPLSHHGCSPTSAPTQLARSIASVRMLRASCARCVGEHRPHLDAGRLNGRLVGLDTDLDGVVDDPLHADQCAHPRDGGGVHLLPCTHPRGHDYGTAQYRRQPRGAHNCMNTTRRPPVRPRPPPPS
jgi:hypothetical protein